MSKRKTLHVDDAVAVGARIREARKHAGISQRGLAGDDCTAAYISRLELGQRVPSIQLLRRLATRLGVDADFLATGEPARNQRTNLLLDAEVALRLDDVEAATRLYEQALLDPRTKGQARAEALGGLGRIALRGGRYPEAIEFLSRAVEASRLEVEDLPGIAECLARAYAAAGQIVPSVALLERCVARYEAAGDILLYIRFASLLGYALTDSGDFAGAQRVVARALARGHDVRDPYARARLYWSQSRLLAEQAQPAAAEEYARKTLETLRVTEDGYRIALALETLAHINLELGNPAEALDLLDEGAPLIQSTGSPPDIAHYELERARVLAALGYHDEAAALAMQLAGELGDAHPVARGRSYLLLGDVFRAIDEVERAQELYELAAGTLEAHPASKYLVTAYQRLAELMKAKGRTEAALELLERALAVQSTVAALPRPTALTA